MSDLLKRADALNVRLAVVLWKYTDPSGNDFYLPDKRMKVRSPYTGKSFTTRPERESMSEVSKELREEAKKAAKAPGLARAIKKTLAEAVKTNDEALLHRADALMQELRRELQGGDSASYTIA